MGKQIVQQPDGKYAVFSSISDTLCVVDATEEEIIQYFGDIARERAERETKEIFDQLRAGQKPYYQFTMTWAQAVKQHLPNNTGDEEYSKIVQEVIERNKKIKKE